MPAFELLNAGQSTSKNWANQVDNQRAFHVDGIRPDMIDWGVDGLPSRGDEHPREPSALARVITANEFGDGLSSLVTIRYSTSDIAYSGTRPIEPITFLWNVSFETVNVGVPSAFIRTASSTTGTEPTILSVWDYSVDPTPETRTVIQARWRVMDPGFSEWANLAVQNNKVHKLGPDKYLFKSGGMKALGRNSVSGFTGTMYEVLGSWTLDLGTPQQWVLDSGLVRLPGDLVYHLPPPGFNSGTHMRPPYHEIKILPSPDPVAEPIKLWLRRLYSEDLDGWRNLPGAQVLPFD